MRILVLITAYIVGRLAHGRAHHHTPPGVPAMTGIWKGLGLGLGILALVPVAVVAVLMIGWLTFEMTLEILLMIAEWLS